MTETTIYNSVTEADISSAHTTLEFYLLEVYMTLCSILVVILNSLLLFLLITKVRCLVQTD